MANNQPIFILKSMGLVKIFNKNIPTLTPSLELKALSHTYQPTNTQTQYQT